MNKITNLPKDDEILTPMRAIRAKCLDCSGYSAKEADLCPDTSCPIYPYRKGHMPKGFKKTYAISPFLERI